MSARQVTCFIAVCDVCEEEYEHDYTPHWPNAGDAINDAVDGGEWWSDDEALLCSNCKLKPHEFVVSDTYPDACDRCELECEAHAGVPS